MKTKEEGRMELLLTKMMRTKLCNLCINQQFAEMVSLFDYGKFCRIGMRRRGNWQHGNLLYY